MRQCARKIGLIVGCSMFCNGTQAMARMSGIFAQVEEPGEKNFLLWFLECLGLFGFLAMVAGVVLFVGSWIVVFSARRPAVIAAYLVFLLFPLLLAVTGALKGLVGAFSVVAMSQTDLKQSQIVGLLSEVLVLPLSALLVTIPTFAVISIGLFVRTLADKRPATLVQTPETVR